MTHSISDGQMSLSESPSVRILAQSPQDQVGDHDTVTGLVTVCSRRCHKGHCDKVTSFWSAGHFGQKVGPVVMGTDVGKKRDSSIATNQIALHFF